MIIKKHHCSWGNLLISICVWVVDSPKQGEFSTHGPCMLSWPDTCFIIRMGIIITPPLNLPCVLQQSVSVVGREDGWEVWQDSSRSFPHLISRRRGRGWGETRGPDRSGRAAVWTGAIGLGWTHTSSGRVSWEQAVYHCQTKCDTPEGSQRYVRSARPLLLITRGRWWRFLHLVGEAPGKKEVYYEFNIAPGYITWYK